MTPCIVHTGPDTPDTLRAGHTRTSYRWMSVSVRAPGERSQTDPDNVRQCPVCPGSDFA
jgi:hypothetical protein